jgi:hypothetical protein
MSSNSHLEKVITAQMSKIPTVPELSSEYLSKLLAEDAQKRKKLVAQHGIAAYLVESSLTVVFHLTLYGVIG